MGVKITGSRTFFFFQARHRGLFTTHVKEFQTETVQREYGNSSIISYSGFFCLQEPIFHLLPHIYPSPVIFFPHRLQISQSNLPLNKHIEYQLQVGLGALYCLHVKILHT